MSSLKMLMLFIAGVANPRIGGCSACLAWPYQLWWRRKYFVSCHLRLQTKCSLCLTKSPVSDVHTLQNKVGQNFCKALYIGVGTPTYPPNLKVTLIRSRNGSLAVGMRVDFFLQNIR